MSGGDLSQFSMLEIFRLETENQAVTLTTGLLELEQNPAAADRLESLMRAAHSLKGAARIVDLGVAVRVAHAMEDCFVAAQKGRITLERTGIDQLLKGVDILTRISQTPEASVAVWDTDHKPEIDTFLANLEVVTNGGKTTAAAPLSDEDELQRLMAQLAGETPPGRAPAKTEAPAPPPPTPAPVPAAPAAKAPGGVEGESGAAAKDAASRVLRVTAENLNRLLGLAGESMVESRWLGPFTESLLRLKRYQFDLGRSLDGLRDLLSTRTVDESVQSALLESQRKVIECRQFLSKCLLDLEMFDRRSVNLSNRLYNEALACRMRPFADGARGFPRMVRDLARQLGKEIKLDVVGQSTAVDRDILEKLEAPLTHLIRNAMDHGIESPEDRTQKGKPSCGTVLLEARHSAGMLLIIVADDGKGIDLDKLREAVVRKKLTTEETAKQLSESELLEFLFLPGFSMKGQVTEISGRGVGLDIVQDLVRGVRGSVRISSQLGKGTRFQLQLPLTLSVMRTLLVDIAGEPYAFPLAYITRTLRVPREQIETTEGRQHVIYDGQRIGLVTGHQILEKNAPETAEPELPIIVLGERGGLYGVIVDRFRGEQELVVHPLDSRLGKVRNISAGSLMEDGSPTLIVDVDDMVRSIEKLVSGGRLSKVQRNAASATARANKRVLVVDDSLTVRELERKVLESRGYEVDVAVDGMDGWNAVRTGSYDLVLSDVDMPRMDGIELVTLIKKDASLKSLPVMIISYKDREEDRRRGLEAGANYYLTKGSFHDETLMNAVVDLIGEA